MRDSDSKDDTAGAEKLEASDLSEVVDTALQLRNLRPKATNEVTDEQVSAIIESTGVSRKDLIRAQAIVDARQKRRWMSFAILISIVGIGGFSTKALWWPTQRPSDPVEAALLSDTLQKEALRLITAKKYPDAVLVAREAVATDPSGVLALDRLGLALEKDKQSVEALRAYRKAVEVGGNKAESAVPLQHMAFLLSETSSRPEAITLYRRALTLKPDFALAWNNLGWSYQESGLTDKAITCYWLALKADPTFTVSRRNLHRLMTRLGRGSELSAKPPATLSAAEILQEP